MDDECFVANVDNTADATAGPERCHSSWVILDRSVIVAVLDFLFVIFTKQ